MDECKAVNIGVDYDSEVIVAGTDFIHYSGEVFFYWFGVVCEIAVGLTVEEFIFYAEAVEKLGENYGAY